MTKSTKWSVHPVKTQISLGIHPVWSESLLSAWRKLGSLATHWGHSEDSDQTGQMPRLIWRDSDLTGQMPRRILSLRWAHRSFCWFCHKAAHIVFESLCIRYVMSIFACDNMHFVRVYWAVAWQNQQNDIMHIEKTVINLHICAVWSVFPKHFTGS